MVPFFNRKPVYMWPVYFKGNLWSDDLGYNHGILLASAGTTQPMNINNPYFYRLNSAIGAHQYLWIRCCHLKSERVQGHGERLTGHWEHFDQTIALCLSAVTALQNLSLGAKTWLILMGCEHPEPLHISCSRICPARCYILRACWEKKEILRLKWKLAIIMINLNSNCLHLTWNSGRSCTQHSSPRLRFSEFSFASLMHFKTFWSRTAQGCSVLLCANWFLTPSPPFRGEFELNWPPSLPSDEWILNFRQEWAPSLEIF